MNNMEIQAMLERAYESTFLESIEILTRQEKEYKKSDFYKNTQIPLMELYKNYYIYAQNNYDFTERINNFFRELDIKSLLEKAVLFLESLQQTEVVQNFLKNITNFINSEDIVKYGEELKKELIKLQK